MTGGCSMHGAFVVLEELGLQIDPGLGFGSTRLAAVFLSHGVAPETAKIIA